MEENGISFARLYWYEDDPETAYFSELSVNLLYRSKGIATKLMQMCEEEAIKEGSKYMCLAVIKNSWMHQWYKRREFKEIEYNHPYNNKNTIWMKKKLI